MSSVHGAKSLLLYVTLFNRQTVPDILCRPVHRDLLIYHFYDSGSVLRKT